MTQQIIVYIIGALVVLYIGVRVFRIVTRRSNPCAGCSGCDLKDEFLKRQQECREDPSLRKPQGGCGCGC